MCFVLLPSFVVPLSFGFELEFRVEHQGNLSHTVLMKTFSETSNSCCVFGGESHNLWVRRRRSLQDFYEFYEHDLTRLPKQTHFSLLKESETREESTRLLKSQLALELEENMKNWNLIKVSSPLRRMAALAGIICSWMKPLVQFESMICSTSSGVNDVFSTIVSSTDRIWSPTDSAPHRSEEKFSQNYLDEKSLESEQLKLTSNARRDDTRDEDAGQLWRIKVHREWHKTAQHQAHLLVHRALDLD